MPATAGAFPQNKTPQDKKTPEILPLSRNPPNFTRTLLETVLKPLDGHKTPSFGGILWQFFKR